MTASVQFFLLVFPELLYYLISVHRRTCYQHPLNCGFNVPSAQSHRTDDADR